MAKDRIIDGYYLNSSGAWSQNSSGKTNNVSATTSENGNSQILKFADKNLEQAVRNEINKPTGDLYKSDVEKITLLYGDIRDIKEIGGIENLTNLQSLSISSSQLSDINALKELTNLKSLTLIHCQMSDLNALKGLTNLEKIDIVSCNKLSDISALKELTNLT